MLLTATGPWLVWPITLIANIVHAYLYKNVTRSTYQEFDSNGIFLGVKYSYIVVKNFLFFLYNLIIVFISFETLFPIYEWYQLLAGLAAKKPYRRPTPEEVEAGDVFDDPFGLWTI